MKSKIILSIKGGVIATAVMSLLIYISLALGFPRLPGCEVLADKLQTSIFVGLVIHFIIGIFFAAIYLLWFRKRLWGDDAVRGMTFGLFPFVLSQMAALTTGGLDPLLFLGSLIGHLAYGLILGLVTKNKAIF